MLQKILQKLKKFHSDSFFLNENIFYRGTNIINKIYYYKFFVIIFN